MSPPGAKINPRGHLHCALHGAQPDDTAAGQEVRFRLPPICLPEQISPIQFTAGQCDPPARSRLRRGSEENRSSRITLEAGIADNACKRGGRALLFDLQLDSVKVLAQEMGTHKNETHQPPQGSSEEPGKKINDGLSRRRELR